jgi:DNA-binding NarL/FixJ family response regulator
MMPLLANGSLSILAGSLISKYAAKWELGAEAVRAAVELRPDIAILEMAAADDLQVANELKQHIPNLPLLVVAEEVSPEIEKEALAQGVDAVFPKQDDPTALALNARALYELTGNHGEVGPSLLGQSKFP